MVGQVLGQVLGHALGQRRDQHALARRRAADDLGEHVVDLGGRRTHFDLRIEESCRAHDLLDELPLVRELVGAGRRGNEDHLRRESLPLLELERPVVERRGQAEAVLDQRLLARTVAAIHGAELRDRLVALVHDQQRVGRQVIVEARWRFAGFAPGEVARIVLDARAVADLADHLEVELRALLEPLRLDQLAGRVQLLQALAQFLADLVHRGDHAIARRHVVGARINRVARQPPQHPAEQRIDERELRDGVVVELDTHGIARRFGREDVDDVAAHAERAWLQVDVVARVLHLGQPPQQPPLVDALAAHQVQHHRQVGARIAEAVDARDRGDDDRIAPLEQRLGGREAHLLDVLVGRGVLGDVEVAGRHVGLGLIVIVVRDEVLDRIVGKVLSQLAIELRRQRLVVRQHQRRPLHPGDDVGDGVRIVDEQAPAPGQESLRSGYR